MPCAPAPPVLPASGVPEEARRRDLDPCHPAPSRAEGRQGQQGAAEDEPDGPQEGAEGRQGGGEGRKAVAAVPDQVSLATWADRCGGGGVGGQMLYAVVDTSYMVCRDESVRMYATLASAATHCHHCDLRPRREAAPPALWWLLTVLCARPWLGVQATLLKMGKSNYDDFMARVSEQPGGRRSMGSPLIYRMLVLSLMRVGSAWLILY